MLIPLLALGHGCDYLPGFACGDVPCLMQVNTEKRIYDFGEEIDLTFSLTAARDVRVDLFEDRVCNLRFFVTEGGRDLLSGYRSCVTSDRAIPDKGFRDSGPDDSERATYRRSKPRRESIGPDRPLQFTVHAMARLEKGGRIFVRLADDVYFEFLDATTLSIELTPYHWPMYDEGRFGGYLRMERVYTGDGEKLAIRPVVLQMTGSFSLGM